MTSPAELLLAILRQGTEPTHPAMDTMRESDWDALLASTHADLHPYLAYRLQALTRSERIPLSVREALQAARRSGVVAQLQRTALLRRMAAALDETAIPFVVLKGMVLAHLSYPEPGLRPMSDIDLWTRPEHLDAAAETLLAAGLQYPARLITRKPAAERPEAAPTRVFELPGTGLVVEIHGQVKSMLAVSASWEEGAWARRIPAVLGEVEVQVLELGDTLTHLAVHCSAHHRFEFGLRALLDISLWLEYAAEQISWPTMQERWKQDGAGTWIYLTLALARDLLDAPVPTEYLRNTERPAHFDELRALAQAQVLGATKTMPPALARLSTLPSFGARAKWLANRLTAWYWNGREDVPRTPLETVRQAGRRMAHDIRYKIPPYLRGLVSGNLRGKELRQRRELAAGRARMAELVALEREGGGEGDKIASATA